jgi:hypothetical protein
MFGSTIAPASRSSLIGPITTGVKCARARSAGNSHAACDVAGTGNQFKVRIALHRQTLGHLLCDWKYIR